MQPRGLLRCDERSAASAASALTSRLGASGGSNGDADFSAAHAGLVARVAVRALSKSIGLFAAGSAACTLIASGLWGATRAHR
jgi:hypothetical protein